MKSHCECDVEKIVSESLVDKKMGTLGYQNQLDHMVRPFYFLIYYRYYFFQLRPSFSFNVLLSVTEPAADKQRVTLPHHGEQMERRLSIVVMRQQFSEGPDASARDVLFHNGYLETF